MKEKVFLLLSIITLATIQGCTKCDETDEFFLPVCSVEHIQEIYAGKQSAVNTKSCGDVFLMSPGELIPDWSSPTIARNTETEQDIVEFNISTQLFYLVQYPDGLTIETSRELLYVHDGTTGNEDIFIVYFIPEDDKQKNLNLLFDNDGNTQGFTGIKLYTTLSGIPIRVNKYIDGELRIGLFIPTLTEEETIGDGYDALVDILGTMTILQVERVATKSTDSYYGGTIQASYCIAEFEENRSPTSSDLYMWSTYYILEQKGFGYTDPCDRQFNNCSGAGGGSGIYRAWEEQDIENRWLKKLKNIEISSVFQSRIDNYYSGAFSTIAEMNCPMVQNLIDGLDITTISIDLDTGDFSTKPEGTISQMVINIKLACDQPDNAIAVLEELFHAFQLQNGCLQDGWQKGDREFEAKVFEAVIIKDYGFIYNRFDDINLQAFTDYYHSLLEDTYLKAFEEYERYFYGKGYPRSEFPITDIFTPENRIKHIAKIDK